MNQESGQLDPMRTFHFSRNYNLFGVIFLALASLVIYIIANSYQMLGAANMALTPLLLGVFILGLYTGRPCLRIEDDTFEYRPLPFGRIHIVELSDIVNVEIQGKEILVYCEHQVEPVRIKSNCFSRDELPEVTEYFDNIKSRLIA